MRFPIIVCMQTFVWTLWSKQQSGSFLRLLALTLVFFFFDSDNGWKMVIYGPNILWRNIRTVVIVVRAVSKNVIAKQALKGVRTNRSPELAAEQSTLSSKLRTSATSVRWSTKTRPGTDLFLFGTIWIMLCYLPHQKTKRLSRMILVVLQHSTIDTVSESQNQKSKNNLVTAWCEIYCL